MCFPGDAALALRTLALTLVSQHPDVGVRAGEVCLQRWLKRLPEAWLVPAWRLRERLTSTEPGLPFDDLPWDKALRCVRAFDASLPRSPYWVATHAILEEVDRHVPEASALQVAFSAACHDLFQSFRRTCGCR